MQGLRDGIGAVPSRARARLDRDFVMLLAVSVAFVAGTGRVAHADTRTVDFENPPYVLGSINGQDTWAGQTPPGITINPSVDQGVTAADAHTGSQSFRMSGFFSSGSFGDWPFSPSLVDGAGEPGAAADGFSGGTLQARFTATVFFKSATGAVQDSHVTLSPDRGDGARMSWIRVSDNVTDPSVFTNDARQGLSVSFFDYPLPGNPNDCDGGPSQVDSEGKCFVFHTLATNLNRSTWHRIDVEMEFYAGKGNDVVRVTVDGGTPFRGTSWEDFFENNSNPPNHTATVDSILFRVGGSGEGNSGDGFYFDDLTYTSGPCLAAPRFVAPSGDDSYNDCRDSGTPCRTIQHGVDVACAGDTITVAAGTYPEQVSITKSNLTVTGVGGPIIQPTSVVSDTTQGSPCSNGVGTAIVLVSGVSGVTLNGLNVDGSLVGSPSIPPRFIGIYYRNASGAINGGSVLNIRNNPLNGVQNGLGIEAQAKGPSSITVNVTGVTVSGYQKNGITFNGCGDATAPDGNVTGVASGNTVTGAGATPQIAQNGIQVGFGAGPVTITGNNISGDRYTGNPANGTGAGILIYSSQSNIITLNDVSASNNGIALASNVAETTGNVLTCNRVRDDNAFSYEVGISADAAANTVHDNAIQGNAIGVDGTAISSGTLDAENNWWGCPTGANTGGCDTATANVDFTPFRSVIPPCVSCTSDGDCSDGLACTGTETCVSGSCASGTPVDCSSFVDQCNDAACAEPAGNCPLAQKVNGFGCNDGNVCTTSDTCQNGICVGTGGGDADGDGYCDGQEIQAGCDPNDFAEIPPQANVYSGGRAGTGGEVLLTFRAPSSLKVNPTTDPSCTTTAGACNLGFCMTGKVGDPCVTNSQCNQPAGKCRLVINYAAVPDLMLLTAALKQAGQPSQSEIAAFSPVSPGCTRKIDLSLPSGFRKAILKLKASGTTNGHLKKDRDKIKYKE